MFALVINKTPLRLIISIIGIFYFFPLNAQEIHTDIAQQEVEFEHIGESHGVNKFISCIYRDSRGFLWFGSAGNGLYKYDAYEFENFNYNYNDSVSLIMNDVNRIFHEDSAGDIWIRAGDQLHRYNLSTNNFTRFLHNPDDPYSVNDGRINSVVEDRRGNIWIGSQGRVTDKTIGGLTMYEAESGKFIKYGNGYETSNSFGINGISSLLVDNSGALWIGRSGNGVERFVWDSSVVGGYRFDKFKYASNNPGDLLNYAILEIVEDQGSIWFGTCGGGLLRYEKRKNEIKQYRIHPQEFHKNNIVTILSLDPEGKLWLGTSGGLATFDRVNDTIILYCNDPGNPLSITSGPVNSIVHDPEGSSWIITNGNWYTKGINRLDRKTNKFYLYQHNSLDPASLSTNLLNTSFVDNTGILWVGTYDGGIDKFDPQKRKFNFYQCIPDSPIGMPEGRIQVIFEDHKGVFWIGTHDYGLFRFDRKSGKISNYMFNPDNPKSINNNTILSICEGPMGILWMGGLGGLKKLDMETMEFRNFLHNPDDPNSISADHIMSIYRDNSGILWIGTLDGGLNLFDPETEKFEVYRKNSDNQEGFNANTIFFVYEDSNGTIWLGSNNGLFKCIPGKNGNSDKFLHYKHDNNNLNSISSNVVRTLVEDNSGNLWIGTDGGGLNKFNLKNETFTIYTMEDGLPNNAIWGILVDEKGNLWISTNNGLSRFNPETEKFSNYDQSDGLQGSQFNFNTYYKSRAGEMFFGGDKGINYFYPDSVKNNPYVPPIVITDFKLYNKTVPVNENSPLKKSITELGELELKYNENFISFEFAALNFTNSHKNQYKYRMIGLDPDTVYSGTRRFADYTNIKPGKYTFWVTGSNNDGIWNEKGISLRIVIHPPWWRSRLAYSLYIVFVILMVSGFIRWRTWRLRKDKEELEKQVKERTREIEEKDFHILEMDRMKSRFFTNISHEFRTPLTLILSPLEEIMVNKSSKDKDYNELGVIRRNGLRLLDLVNQLLDLSKLDSGKLKLELMEADIIKILKLSFSSFISLADKKRIQYNFQLPDDELFTCFDKDKLETIMNNLLSNAFKYTPEDGEIECIVHIKEAVKGGEKDVIEISVRDSGPGIDENKLDFIFDRFYQADEQHHIEGGGTGIGLSLTKELVHLIHGEIKVASKPGEGSCFMVTIPLGKDHLKESEYVIVKPQLRPEPKLVEDILSDEISADSIETESVPDKKTIQVLIVEDNRDLSAYLKEQLQRDYLIEEAPDGEEGLKKAIKIIPDLIITDIMMPKMDGVEFCKRVKTNERTSHIPVVLLTAKADIESRIEGLETGADDYIIKPFNIHELRTRVKNLIEQRQILRKRFTSNLNVTPKDIAFNSYDVQFINRIFGVVEDHYADFDFGVKDLQGKAGMSHTQLYRKIFALTGLSPSKFIRTLRLKRAAKLMEQKNGNVTKIAYEVGFNNLAYFTKCFKELYGVSPSGYLKQFSGQ